MFKLSIFAFLLSMFTFSAIADDDIAALIVDPGPGVCNLINAGIDVPGIIDISVCKK
ncbi:TPA: hypothetical protein ACGRM4_000758 [Klebsiella oxytoca]|uniref:hypothetical protein n=1 Tax=Klebsiella TaxID=570 RepID=UPI00143D1F7F|nr:MULTISPECIES: hypothetical protein [Klebsiella]EJG2191270.1 hypothetical protein [Klebsiella oxytoca]EKV6448744.1 hypothetical protein [Klebsiella oxytoca]MBK0162828.1 hypothetical protein [Klebsiella sp. S69]MBL0805368.1 hypothetical protein [Klebsiella oxytoca]MCW9633752.1 hypothetical protein [Klebsiella oxytoca]